MHNPDAKETQKIPLSMPSLDWAAQRDGTLMSLFNGTGAPGGMTTSKPTMSGQGGGYDGTSDPGAPGEPV